MAQEKFSGIIHSYIMLGRKPGTSHFGHLSLIVKVCIFHCWCSSLGDTFQSSK